MFMRETIDMQLIPKHWHVKRLGEVCDVLDNLRKPINSSERQQRNAGKDIKELFPYYGATGQVGLIDGFITDGEFILIGEDGAPFLDVLKDKAYKIKGKTWVNNHAHILKGKVSVVIDDFVLYYLNSIRYRPYVNGTTRLKLTKSNLVDIPFILPPLPEQLAIVSKIEELLSDLDNGKQLLLTAQQQLKIYRQSLLKAAFENSNSTKYILQEVTKKIQIGPFGTQLHKEDYIENGIPLINPMHIQAGKIKADPSYTITREKRKSLPNYILEEGDIIMGRRGEMGRCGLVNEKETGWFCGTGSLYFRPQTDLLCSRYLYYYLSSQPIKKYLIDNAGGTTMANLNLKIANEIPISLPHIKEQRLIVDDLESKLTVCDKIEETIAQSLLQAETLRQSILKKAFEGKLT
jgi:type I restriction enzyme S subunit